MVTGPLPGTTTDELMSVKLLLNTAGGTARGELHEIGTDNQDAGAGGTASNIVGQVENGDGSNPLR